MSEPQKKLIRIDQAVVMGVGCLVIGFTLGMIVYHFTMGSTGQPPMPAMAQRPAAPPVQPPGAALQSNAEEIREARKFAEQNPKNRQAWVTLGNILFDSDQPAEAIQAYTKALELGPNDADVLTDRGVMYRRIGDFASAVADFRKAADLSPKHIQSVYNLGLVLLHDLQDARGAKEAWERLMTRNPPPELAADMNQRLFQLQQILDNPSLMPPKTGGLPPQMR